MRRRRRARTLPPEGSRASVDEELLHHIEERTERLIAEGWDEAAARAEAERRFGDLSAWRSRTRAEGGKPWGWLMALVESIGGDTLYAVRGVRARPGFAAAVVATLALGIGATGAVFSVVDAILLRPLPYHDPERLVELNLRLSNGFILPSLMAEQVEPWSRSADFLVGIALHAPRSMVRTDREEPEQLAATAVSPGLAGVIGARASLGRTFAVDEARPGARTAVLSWAYWTANGSDPDVLGSRLELDGESWTVVGVLERGTKFPVSGRSDLWIPLASDLTVAGQSVSQISAVGRLPDGLDLATAQARSDALAPALAETHPIEVGWSVQLRPVSRWRGNQDTLRGLWTVSVAVGLMLLIAVFNVANLLMVRADARRPEVSVRRALGASRLRIVRQVLAECVVLSLLGGFVATGLAAACVEGMRRS